MPISIESCSQDNNTCGYRRHPSNAQRGCTSGDITAKQTIPSMWMACHVVNSTATIGRTIYQDFNGRLLAERHSRWSRPRVTLQCEHDYLSFASPLWPGPKPPSDRDLQWRIARGIPILRRRFHLLFVGTHKPGVHFVSPRPGRGRAGHQKARHSL